MSISDNSSAISYKPKINSMKVQGENTRSRAQREGETVEDNLEIVRDSQGGGKNGRTTNRSAGLARRHGHVALSADLRSDVSVHRFWNWVTTVIFDVRIIKLNAGSYVHMTPEYFLAKAEKDNK